ncbi:hypothetical protein [Salmonella enterica]|uniref:hypothetical protein n=1 Tax=Salmonella enterica TaxID=28901 RepID=UPI00398C45F7
MRLWGGGGDGGWGGGWGGWRMGRGGGEGVGRGAVKEKGKGGGRGGAGEVVREAGGHSVGGGDMWYGGHRGWVEGLGNGRGNDAGELAVLAGRSEGRQLHRQKPGRGCQL